jgi:hypothetical protein
MVTDFPVSRNIEYFSIATLKKRTGITKYISKETFPGE